MDGKAPANASKTAPWTVSLPFPPLPVADIRPRSPVGFLLVSYQSVLSVVTFDARPDGQPNESFVKWTTLSDVPDVAVDFSCHDDLRLVQNSCIAVVRDYNRSFSV